MVDHERRRRRSRLRQLVDAFRIQNPPSLLARERLAAASGSDPNNESGGNNSNNNSSSSRGGRRNNNNRDQTISEFLVAARRAAGAEQHQQQQQQRRRLPRGWWPDQNKRAGLKLKAMDDLKDETFVITEEHIEYVFKEEHDDFTENNDAADDPTISSSEQQAEYEINLVLPHHPSCSHQPSKNKQQLECNDATTNNNSNNNHSSNCAICMIDYDIGDVVIYSKHCSHVFHQDCILNWFSHSNVNCPTCRSCFWVEDDDSMKKISNSAGDVEGGNNGDEGREGMNNNNNRRPRSDTADTEILGGEISRGDSVDVDVAISSENITLSPVAEV